MSDRREFLVLTPGGPPDASLAIAGSRAGAIGILNLEFSNDWPAAEAGLQTLEEHARGPFGVLLDADADEWLNRILDRAPERLELIVLTGTAARITQQIEVVHHSNRRAFVVVTSLEQAEAARAAGADAVIAKGHESGGWVGEETAFVLLQRLVPRLDIPVWIQGGVGIHTAAACVVAGAAGLVLDSQLLLTRESPLPEAARARIGVLDGSETIVLGASLGAAFRSYTRPDLPVCDELRRAESTIMVAEANADEARRDWREAVRRRAGWRRPEAEIFALGQDAVFAASLARRFGTVGGVLSGLRQAIREHYDGVKQANPFAEATPLARSHRTRYPIVQGPMTRVSDRAAFASAVATEGALPFLALALMRAPEVEALLKETKALLGERPWGVGILGFVPPELRAEQLAVIQAYKPPFALIAGGRPDQAKVLEDQGIPTYLHVPSPGLLKMFLQEGARRFIFEGRECGGHVGPRTSFVLWESMIEVLLENVPAGSGAADYHVLFAGGIHDGLSTAMVAAMAAPLASRGICLGVLAGTAYLFTEEAVHGGAILPGFQKAALLCESTALLESGPGHATRCVPSPFVESFAEEKRRLVKSGLSPEALKNELEVLNIGRLRIASKGLDRHPRHGEDPAAPKLIDLDDETQWQRGMYMIGQVAALRRATCTLAELHAEISCGSSRVLETLAPLPAADEPPSPPPAAIAIVGMATILPGASDLPSFWSNILNRVDAISEVPADRWDWRHYFDPDRNARDKVYSRWGGFIGDVPFDPVDFGMPPSTLPSIEPFQLLALLVVRAALQDAGFNDRPFPRERTSVILGAGGGGADLTSGYMVRSSLPELFGDTAEGLTDRLGGALPEWTEDSFAGILMNVAAGRVANRFNLGGVNYTVDAACASSLAAIYLAVRDLEARTSDVAIVGGVDAIQNPFAFLCFSKTQALSPTGRCRTFDAQGDGIAISEGFAAVVLKRLDDAERDGDKIYAVIRGVGGSSDGRDRSMTAPRPEGQVRALRRAYGQAGFSPATVGLIEAHGTGTVAGDQAEVQSLTTFFGAHQAERQSCAVGSVKSMIGHTKATAGVAGLVKVALALNHRVLPPTLNVTQPNPKANFPSSPFYVNTEARPWIHGAKPHPRRAGVSAFGFGGTNFHVVLEEYTGQYLPETSATPSWPSELFRWRGKSRADISSSIARLLEKLDGGARPRLCDLAYTLDLQARSASGPACLAIVADTLAELTEKLRRAQTILQGAAPREHSPQGIHFSDAPLAADGGVAFLFPGQGSQYVNMARDVAMTFPEAREAFERADRVLADRLAAPLSRSIFPPPVFNADDEKARQAALTQTDVAQAALGATELALLGVLRSLGVEPEMTAGHSYGEFVALAAGGCYDDDVLLRLSEARGRFIREEATGECGTMAAVDASPEALRPLLADPELTLANLNAPKQTVLSGTEAAIERARQWCAEQGLKAKPIPVACAFHSPLVAPAQRRLAELLRQTPMLSPRVPIFSNTTAAPYPAEPSQIAEILSEHLVRPVEFVRQIEAMHDAGARLFVEVGPRSVLSGLVGRTLAERPHLCVSLDQPGRPGLSALLQGLAALAAEGVSIATERLYVGRSVRRLDLGRLEQETGQPRLAPTTWLVNGGRALPAAQRRAPGAIAQPRRRPVRVHPIGADAPASSSPVAPHAPAPATAVAKPNGHSAASPARHATVEPPPREFATQRRLPSRDEARPNGQAHGTPTSSHVLHQAVTPFAAAGGQGVPIMNQFQQVMQRFLQTQQNVMQDLLAAYHLEQGAFPHPALQNVHAPHAGAASPAVVIPVPVPVPPAAAPSPNGGGHHEIRSRHAEAHAAPPVPVAPSPAPVREPTAAPPPSASPVVSREQLTERLLTVVSERTGYPTEMLALDADMEADLGIDSIKRVEIAGTVVRSLPIPEDRSPEIERLTAARSLRQVVDQLEAMLAPSAPPVVGSSPAPTVEKTAPAPAPMEIGRFTLVAAPAPPTQPTASLAPGRGVLIIDDETGIGERIAKRLEAQGHPVARVVANPGAAQGPGVILSSGLAVAGEAARVVELAHARCGRVAGLVHLAALRDSARRSPADLDRWLSRLTEELKGLFLITQALQADLEQSAGDGGAAVLAATCLGGGFGVEGLGPDVYEAQGGLAGFLKTLAQEWPSVRVKTIDLGPADPETAASCLFDELRTADGVVEVGYRDGHRTFLSLAPSSLDDLGPLPVDAQSVVLVTGGARGITAEAAIALAEAARPILWLVGRTPVPEGPEPPQTAGLEDPQALRRALLEELREQGLKPTPVQVEDRYRRLVHEREVRLNLDRLTGSGARVVYRTCDVSDPSAFSALIDEIYHEHGRIDGVIHGAGLIEDKLIRDKRPESFDRVVATKAIGAAVLAAKLRSDQLRFLVFFSSVSGRFGNRGQADYAAANEVLNKLAQKLDRCWPARVVAINWGPWLTTGMVSAEVQRQFAERGVSLIRVEDGCRRLLDEIRAGRKGEAEIVIGGGGSAALGAAAHPAGESSPVFSSKPADELPLLHHARGPMRGDADSVVFERTIDLAHDLYLHDHRLDGRPVFPFAVAQELMAEVASAGWPGLQVQEVRDVRLLKGIVLDTDQHPVRVTARPKTTGASPASTKSRELVVEVTIAPVDEPRRPHYKATITLGGPLPQETYTPDPSVIEGAGPMPMTVGEAYRSLLFHGPCFQHIQSIEALGPRGARAWLKPSSPSVCLASDPVGDWTIDPIVVDSAFQIQVLWARLHWDVTLLPAGVGAYRRFGPLRIEHHGTPELIRYEMRVRSESQAPFCRADHFFHGPGGRLLGALIDVEGTGSKAMNRLAGGIQG